MLKTLTPTQEEAPSLLGNNILAKGSDYLVWFCKPQKRQVFFKCSEFDGESALTDHPGLIFMIGKGKWYVFATKTSMRPTANTPLYVAPYFNVWKGGHICTGNIDTPKGKMKFNTAAWEEAFFRSYFSHPNQHEKGALTTFRGGIFALWKALMKGRIFPKETLVPEGKNLGEMFESVVKHG